MAIHRHYLVYKPIGFVSQFIYTHKRKKGLLGDLHRFREGTMAIGRLDVKSEGLLLLTTDGKESSRIRSKKIEKEYYVLVDGIITSEAVEALRNGVDITVEKACYRTLPAKVKMIQTLPFYLDEKVKPRDERHGPVSWVSITINEGKFRQVRKMTAAVGFPTLRLIRVRIGMITLGDMEPGEVREVLHFNA